MLSKSVYEWYVLVSKCWKMVPYNNLTRWFYALTQNTAYCYTYKKSRVFSLYSSARNLLFYIPFLNL